MNTTTRALFLTVSDYEAHKVTGQDCDLNGPINDNDLATDKVNSVEIKRLTQTLNEGTRRQKRRARRKIRKLKRGRTTGAVRIRELMDSEATADNVRSELAEFLRLLKPGERGIFYRSGHGSYISNDNTEADGTCEVFCAYDFLNGGAIQDDEFSAIINENLHPDAELVVLIDTCHSGDSMRSTLERQRGVTAPKGLKAKTFVNSDQNPKNVIVWAACAPDEVAWERPYDGLVYGAFTFAIQDYIPQIVDGTINWNEAHTNVCRLLAGENSNGGQTPQLERYA